MTHKAIETVVLAQLGRDEPRYQKAAEREAGRTTEPLVELARRIISRTAKAGGRIDPAVVAKRLNRNAGVLTVVSAMLWNAARNEPNPSLGAIIENAVTKGLPGGAPLGTFPPAADAIPLVQYLWRFVREAVADDTSNPVEQVLAGRAAIAQAGQLLARAADALLAAADPQRCPLSPLADPAAVRAHLDAMKAVLERWVWVDLVPAGPETVELAELVGKLMMRLFRQYVRLRELANPVAAARQQSGVCADVSRDCAERMLIYAHRFEQPEPDNNDMWALNWSPDDYETFIGDLLGDLQLLANANGASWDMAGMLAEGTYEWVAAEDHPRYRQNKGRKR